MGAMNSLGWDELIAFFEQAQLGRLFRQGLWDPEADQRRLHLMSDPLYLDSDLGMLAISTIINDSYLSFDLVEEPTWDKFEEAGEEDNAGLVDLGYEFFGDRQTVRCHELRCAYITAPEPASDFGQIVMASIATDGGELVTFNPWNFGGLRIQGGIHLESVLDRNDYLAARTAVRVWTRSAT